MLVKIDEIGFDYEHSLLKLLNNFLLQLKINICCYKSQMYTSVLFKYG